MTTLPIKPAFRRAGKVKSRARTFTMAAITVLATTGAMVAANMLAIEHRQRPDVTMSREQTLSERTQQLLARLDKPFRVVIAADLRSLDMRARQRVQDVLDEMRRASDNFNYTMLDTASASGVSGYRALVSELIERDRKTIAGQAGSIELANAGIISLASYLNDSLSPALGSVRDALGSGTPELQTLRNFLDQAGGATRNSARDLSDASVRANDALKWKLGDLPLPATDRAATALADGLAPTVERLNALARDLDKIINNKAAAGPAADQARKILPEVQQRRDQASVVLDAMKRQKRPDLLRIMNVLERGSAALVIGPPDVGIAAIELDMLFPPGSLLDATNASKADLRRRGEELVVSAMGSMLSPNKPVVVLMHGELGELLPQQQLFGRLLDRMRLRGIDVVEWPTAVSAERPRLTNVDPEGTRPVVYVAVSPDSSAAPARAGGLGGSQRAQKLGEAVRSVVDAGGNILLNINPSVIPSHGDADPTVAVLPRFGLTADTARPLLREQVTPRGRIVDTVHMLQPVEGANPINGAVRGLPTAFSWPITLHERPLTEKVRLTVVPLFHVSATQSTWAESQWSRLWQTPAEQRGLISQKDLPVLDEERDGRWPEGRDTGATQRWLVGAAVQRSELNQKPQRAVVIGSNSWFIDSVTQAVMNVDNRPALRNPGNMELFEASVLWLAEQDTLIAQSPTAQAVALIGPIEERSLAHLRLAVIGGLPLLVLVMGALYRLIRG